MMQPQLKLQPISQLPAWLHMLAAVYPPQQVALVGAGNGTGVLVQCLQSLASTAEPGDLQVTLLEPHAPSMAQLTKRLAGQGSPSRCANWQLRPDAVATTEGDHTYHQYSLATENSLLPPEALHSLWPSLQLQTQQLITCVPLASLLPASWLLVDCLPAAHLLQGTPLPASTQVVLTRVVLGDTAAPGTRWDEVANLLAPSGFKAVATFAERNSALGKALWVRNPKGLQQQIEQLAKAKEAETAAKLAEAQARGLEQQAKGQALAQVQALQAEKAQLAEAKDKALGQVQQLEKDKAQALERCDELTKAKEAETAAKIDALKQCDELAKRNSELELKSRELQQKLDAETKARQQEASNVQTLKATESRLRDDMNKGLTNAVKQLEAFQRIRDFLGTVDGLGDFHGWPISPDIGLFLLERMREQHYDLIIEFGSGTSTVLFAQAAQVLEQKAKAPTRIVTFEHDKFYHAKTEQLLKARGLEGQVRLEHAPLVEWRDGESPYLYYDCQATLAELAQQNVHGQLRVLVFVDGPPGVTCSNARYPAGPFISNAFSRHLVDFVLDDASRPEEKQVIELWRSFWKQRSLSFTDCFIASEKGIYYGSLI